MSTKSSIAYGETFHLYKECFDEDGVFLQLDNVQFEATPTSVTVKIPLHVWEYIRAFEATDLCSAHLSDEQIECSATERVDARLARAASANTGAKPHLSGTLIGLGGAFTMGDVSLPRQEQIANLVAHLKKQRAQKQAILDRVVSLSSKSD